MQQLFVTANPDMNHPFCKLEAWQRWGNRYLGNFAKENQTTMIKWIGIYGGINSGIKSLEEVKTWCANQLGSAKPGVGTKAFVCEVKEQVQLTTPAHEVIPYDPAHIAPKTAATNGGAHPDF